MRGYKIAAAFIHTARCRLVFRDLTLAVAVSVVVIFWLAGAAPQLTGISISCLKDILVCVFTGYVHFGFRLLDGKIQEFSTL